MKPSADHVNKIAVLVYCDRMEKDSPGGIARMLEKDADGGAKVRSRAQVYAPFVRSLLTILDLSQDKLDDAASQEPFK